MTDATAARPGGPVPGFGGGGGRRHQRARPRAWPAACRACSWPTWAPASSGWWAGERSPSTPDVTWGRAWHRDKQLVATDDAGEVRALLAATPTWRWSTGPTTLVEGRGLGYRDLRAANPALVYARCRPSRNATGTVEDFGLLVEARSGFCTQLAGHRPGPDLRRRPGARMAARPSCSPPRCSPCSAGGPRPGAGGWAETSLYDGMLATLGCMIGRSERAAPEVEGYWEKGSTFPNFLYRCADGELIQVWFGGKGMYARADRGAGRRAEPGRLLQRPDRRAAQRPGRALGVVLRHPAPRRLDPAAPRGRAWPASPCSAPARCWPIPHLAGHGLAAGPHRDGSHHDRRGRAPPSRWPRSPTWRSPTVPPSPAHTRLGHGPRSVAGCWPACGCWTSRRSWPGRWPPQVLADLGADVIKVEPPEGEAMRAAAYAVAACQRGKRSLALDISAPAGPARGRAADRVGRRGAAQLPGRGGRTAGHRRGDRGPAQPGRRLLPRQRLRHDRAPGHASRATTRSCRR